MYSHIRWPYRYHTSLAKDILSSYLDPYRYFLAVLQSLGCTVCAFGFLRSSRESLKALEPNEFSFEEKGAKKRFHKTLIVMSLCLYYKGHLSLCL